MKKEEHVRRHPFDQLERCHRRLEEACDALSIAGNDHDLDTALDVSAFFARQVRRHEEDEEGSLFPRLLASETLSEAARKEIARLSGEHREHEALHTKLEALTARLRASAEPGAAKAAPTTTTTTNNDSVWSELAGVAELLTRGYRAHIEAEEQRVFPEARTLLSEDALTEMSVEMDARRGR